MQRISMCLGFSLAALTTLWLATGVARADTVLWIDDTANNVGTVDLTTGMVSVIGNADDGGGTLTDIGFGANGTLYGTSFDDLYSINQSTGQATPISALGVGNGGMNALVGYGSGLLAVSGTTDSLYSLTVSPYSAITFDGSTGSPSAGDLAAANGYMYESAVGASGNDELVKLTLSGANITNSTVIGLFTQGGTDFSGVFGLADDGTTMYAVDETTVYTVNLSNAVLTTDLNYSGHGLGIANGTAFVGEATVPEPGPGSLLLVGLGLVAFGTFSRRWRRIGADSRDSSELVAGACHPDKAGKVAFKRSSRNQVGSPRRRKDR